MYKVQEYRKMSYLRSGQQAMFLGGNQGGKKIGCVWEAKEL